jgi:hypothetical protein
MINNKKPAGLPPAGFSKGDTVSIDATILSCPTGIINPHLIDLRAQAAAFMDQTEAAGDWPRHRRHCRVYLALLDVEAGRGQL